MNWHAAALTCADWVVGGLAIVGGLLLGMSLTDRQRREIALYVLGVIALAAILAGIWAGGLGLVMAG